MKKLEKTDWMPSRISVAAGMSRRRFSSVDGSRPKSACFHSHNARANITSPASKISKPATMPLSSVKVLNTRDSLGSSGSKPSAMAKTFVKNANATSWKPTTTLMHAIINVPTLNWMPPMFTSCTASAAEKTTPSPDSKSPGTRNSQRGE